MKSQKRQWKTQQVKVILNGSGFTLLELMVTMMVSSLVVLAAYQLFASTSEAMSEANSLSDTTDRARFALELIASDMRAAGSFASPDSATDPFVHPQQVVGRNIRGIYSIIDHQARKIAPFQATNNRATRSDEIIMLGAYDYPFKFEVSFPTGGANYNTARALNTERGALRFLDIDPFVREPQPVNDIGAMVNGILGPGGTNDYITNRLLSVTDRNGFSQFVSIGAANYAAGVGPDKGLTFDLDPGPNALQARIGDSRAGLEPAGEDDVAYQAALLDAYRYRVCAPANDPGRLRLVKERLDARQLVDNVEPPTNDICENVPVGPGNYVVNRYLVVDRVVDFQVWYDCVAPSVDPNTPSRLENMTWATGWMAPSPADPGVSHGCMFVDAAGNPAGVNTPSNARMAHIRLSVRTENERGDVPNYGFLRADGTTINDTAVPNAADHVSVSAAPVSGNLPNAIGQLQTADVDGDASNAARVVTMQVDVDLINYVNTANRAAPQRQPW